MQRSVGPENIRLRAAAARLWRAVLLPALLFAAFGWPLTAARAQSAADSATARAVVLTRGSLVSVQDLDFGDVLVNTAGTVTVAPSGSIASTGGAVPLNANHTPGSFIGLGTRNRLIQLRVLPTQITIYNGTGGSMIVDNFTIGNLAGVTQNGNSIVYRIVATTGLFTFNVGARLNAAANQPPGTYSGTYNVEFEYQ